MPIPYMGSKRKSAGKIFQTIKNLEPEADTLVDLFCGGFAISEYFLKNGWRVIANDKNKYVIALLQKTIFEGLDENEVIKFIDRERFFDVVQNPDKYDDWYIGYVSCVWSFGNNQRSYLFGKNTEPVKKAGHELVINKNPDLIQKLFPNFPQKYIDGILKQENWHKRRAALLKVSNVLFLKKPKPNILYLQQLERLEQLQRLELFSADYREVAIPKNAIVYCDPPYQGTAEYKEGGFNHEEFWEWVRETSKTNKVYISEYSAPDDFKKKVMEFQQNSTLQGGNNSSQPNECLFTAM